MASSSATSVKQYLDGLPEDRRKTIAKVRKMIRQHLPKGYRETMGWGMINYEIPLATYPDTYNKKPLCYIALAAQKNFNALYLMGGYADGRRAESIRSAFAKAGKKLDMGKSCVRFKTVDDIPLEALGKIVADLPPKKLIAMAEAARRR